MIRSRVLLITIVVLTGCTSERPKLAAQSVFAKADSGFIMMTRDEVRKANLKFDTARVRSLPLRLELAATVQPDETLSTPIASLLPGKAEQVLVRLGDEVKAGQVLATIRSEEIGTIQADYLERLLALMAEEEQRSLEYWAEIMQLETKTAYLQKQCQRKAFLQENKIGARAELESAQSDLGQAESALKGARVKKKSALELAIIKKQALADASKEKLKVFGVSPAEIDRVTVDRTVKSIFQIRAPNSGVIIVRNINPSETIDSNKPLLVITDLSRVWLIGQIFEKDLRRLKVGMPVTCVVDSYPGQEFHGHIEYLGARLDPQTRTLPIRAAIGNPAHKLKPDMFADMRVTMGYQSTLTVPKQALQTIGETQIVFVKHGEAYELRSVSVANEVDSFIQITSGLRTGEQVVTTGSIDLLGKALQSLKH